MKVALAQLNYTIGDFESNKVKIINAINRAKADGADMAVFAEEAVSGAPAYGLLDRVTFLEASEDALIEIASFCDDITVIVGLPIMNDCKTFSAAAVIHNRKIIRYVTRKNIYQREDVGFISSGGGSEIVVINGKRIAVVVGEDALCCDEYSSVVDLVVNIHSSKYARQRIEKRYDKLSQFAFQLGADYLTVNLVGGSTDIIYDGSSAVFNSKGEPLALLASFEEDYAVVDLDNARPVEIPYQNKTANVYRAIKLGLSDFFFKNGYRSACLGLSGGIDSAVVAAVAAEVLGPDNVHVLLMPSQFSSDHSVDDALEMVRNLGLRHDIVSITDVYTQILDVLSPVFGDDTDFGVTEENIQARIRSVLLMALSNKFGHVLLNTTNKSELALGWYTLYGDSVGMLSVLGDVYKSEVFDIAHWINRDREIIPENIIRKAPSAELRPEQKDTDYLPPYDETDSIIYRMIEERQTLEEIINAGYDPDVVLKIAGMIRKNEPKRFQFCPILRVATSTFGVNRKMPLTSRCRY